MCVLEIPQIPFAFVINYQYLQSRAGSGGSKGGARDTPRGPNSFNFMQFWDYLAKSYVDAPPRWVGAPPRGNPGSTTEGSFRKHLKSKTKVPSVLQKD